MIPSIIRKWNFYVPDEEYEQTLQDTLSYLLTKVGNFKPIILQYEKLDSKDITDNIVNTAQTIQYDAFHKFQNCASPEEPQYYFVEDESIEKTGYYEKVEKHYKAYSYCGTVAKNYLIQKNVKYNKELERDLPYNNVMEEVNNGFNYSMDDVNYGDVAEQLIKNISNEIKSMIKEPEKNSLNTNEIKVGVALSELLDNWEDVLPNEIDGSVKLRKNSVLYYLREQVRMSTKELRDNMKKYKKAYKALKKLSLE